MFFCFKEVYANYRIEFIICINSLSISHSLRTQKNGIFVSVRSAVVSNRLKIARGTVFDNLNARKIEIHN